jgi:acyl-CoA thioesterase II
MDGVGQHGNGTAFTSAVTSHTIWYRRPFRTDGWLPLRQHSRCWRTVAASAAATCWPDDGTLVASYAQEALQRLAS